MNPRYCIVKSQRLHQLAAAVDPKLQEGVWEPVGAPFRDAENLEWCQAIYRPERKIGKKTA